MSVPAKKAASKAPSLDELMNKENENKEQKETETPSDENSGTETVHVKEKNANQGPVDDKAKASQEGKAGSDEDKSDEPKLSQQVVSTVPNKTPAELAAETPAETQARYGIDQSVTDEDADNPRVQVYRDTIVNQVPSGTHLHPDIAKDLLNRGIAETTTDSAQVKRTVVDSYDFAESSKFNDKF